MTAAMHAYRLDWKQILALPTITQEQEDQQLEPVRYVSVRGAQELGRKLGKDRVTDNAAYLYGDMLDSDVGTVDVCETRVRYGTLCACLQS